MNGLRFVVNLNNKGSTLLEVLLAFAMMLVVVSVFPLSFSIFLDKSSSEESVQRLEWEVFISQIKKEIRMSDSIQIYPERILLTRDSKVILYEKYGALIRRRVDFTGHETLLQNVKSVTFEKTANGVRVNVIDKYEQAYSIGIQPFVKVEVK